VDGTVYLLHLMAHVSYLQEYNRAVDNTAVLRLKWKIFVSISKDDAEWKSIYDAVVAYGERNGYDCNVPLSYQCTVNKKLIKLGVWLAAQRLNKIKGVLNKEQDELIQVIYLPTYLHCIHNSLIIFSCALIFHTQQLEI